MENYKSKKFVCVILLINAQKKATSCKLNYHLDFQIKNGIAQCYLKYTFSNFKITVKVKRKIYLMNGYSFGSNRVPICLVFVMRSVKT